MHYALVYLNTLLEFDEHLRRNGRVSRDLVIKPRLELPDVFEMLHHANQVTPLLVLEAVIGKSKVQCLCQFFTTKNLPLFLLLLPLYSITFGALLSHLPDLNSM